VRPNLRYLIPLAAALGAGIGPGPLARGSGATPDRPTLDRVARYPPPGAGVAGGFKFSHDGRYLYFLKSEERGVARSLYREDVKTGARELVARPPAAAEGGEPLSREEVLRRERQRIQDRGITLYALAAKADVAIFAHGGAVHLVRPGRDPLRLTGPSGHVIDPQLSPDGASLAFARNGELYVLDLATRAERRLTQGARDVVTHGIAEFIAQEEMDRSTGFWWSPDGSRLAYTEVDETGIPAYPIVHQGAAPWEVESHRYPFAGGPNAKVRLGVVAAAGGETRWLRLSPEEEEVYLARVKWDRDGTLLVQVQARDQHTLRLLRVDPETGSARTLLEDRSDAWVNLHDDLWPLLDGRFLWSGEGSGFRHLELRARDGSLLRRLTSGDWPIDRLEGVDEAAGHVYFTAARDGPLQRPLYRVGLEGGEVERITSEAGWHDTTFSADGRWFVDIQQSAAAPPRALMREGSGRLARVLDPNQDPEVEALSLKPPEFVTLRAADGTLLHGAIYKPVIEPGRRYPALVRVYGGPTAQTVKDSWEMTQDLRAQYLARHGYVVLRLDNRGSPRRGRAFETALFHHLGSVEAEDQVAGARYLARLPYVDGSRLGIYGWSYGGYMAALCLLKAPDLFRAAVAGAPVVDWDGYDTHYTERYMGTPRDNPEGYRGSSLLPLAPRLQGALLIVHGMIDENVHFRHTARLIDALNAAGKTYELLVFPDERHLPRGQEDRRHLEERLVAHFDRHLKGVPGSLPGPETAPK
jgi:dipeptidyl-peptidase-4